MRRRLEIIPLAGIGEIEPGDPLGSLLARAAADAGADLADDDALVISQKAVSKAEGRLCDLDTVSPTATARKLATKLDHDPRLVQLVLDESHALIRAERGVLIAETHSGLVCANAGIDSSNVSGEDRVTLLPVDPDASARALRAEIRSACGAAPAIVIADSFGRPWRLGQTDVAIGCAGLPVLDDWRGRADSHGRELQATAIAIPDEVAAAAELARDKAAGVPAVLVRGLADLVTADDGPGASALRRPEAEDLFR